MASNTKPPGLQIRKNDDGSPRMYWRASKEARALNYEQSIVRLTGATDDEIASECQILQAEMLEWLALQHDIGAHAPRIETIAQLFRVYREQPESPFQFVKWNTRRTYSYALDEIEEAVGSVRLGDISIATLRAWYDDARYPEGPGRDKPDHLRKAHGIVSMLRRVVSFGVSSEIEACDRLDRILSRARFEAPGRRQSAMSADMVQTFVAAAKAHGRLSLALGTALQFECVLRQRDVIGEWEPVPPEGASSSWTLGGRQWANGLTWSHIGDDWRLTKRTTKTGAIVVHDLTLCPLVLEILQAIPEGQRIGPLIIDELAGRPYARDAYQREWRVIADMAGLPRCVWNMDARAGAATEASEAGASLDDIRPTMGHSDAKTTARYVRGKSFEQSRRVAALRLAHRGKK